MYKWILAIINQNFFKWIISCAESWERRMYSIYRTYKLHQIDKILSPSDLMNAIISSLFYSVSDLKLTRTWVRMHEGLNIRDKTYRHWMDYTCLLRFHSKCLPYVNYQIKSNCKCFLTAMTGRICASSYYAIEMIYINVSRYETTRGNNFLYFKFIFLLREFFTFHKFKLSNFNEGLF